MRLAVDAINGIPKTATIAAIVAATVCTVAYFFHGKKKSNTQTSVIVSAIGIQPPFPEPFLPRDQIRDCVVCERIWAHTVENVVMLRLLPNSDSKKETLPLWSGRPYTECLALRQRIMAALVEGSNIKLD